LTRVLGVEERCRADDLDRDRVGLAHVFDGEPSSDRRVLGREVRHEDVLAHRRPCSRARHVRSATLPVHDGLAVRRQDRLVAEHVALDPGGRRVVVDGERAQECSRLLGALLQVGVFPDEVLLLDRGARHARLDEVVLELQLRAVGAVALF
jgi:hypothetical protein